MIRQSEQISLLQGLMKEYIKHLKGQNEDFFNNQDHPHIIIAKKGLDIFKESVYAFVREKIKGQADTEIDTIHKMVQIKQQNKQEIKQDIIGNKEKGNKNQSNIHKLEQYNIKNDKIKELHEINEIDIKLQQTKPQQQKVGEIKKQEYTQKQNNSFPQQIEQQQQFFSCNGGPPGHKLFIEQISQIQYQNTNTQQFKIGIKQNTTKSDIRWNKQNTNININQNQNNNVQLKSNKQQIEQQQDQFKSIYQQNQNQVLFQRILLSICSSIGSYATISKQKNEQSLQKVVGLINHIQGLFLNIKKPIEQEPDPTKTKIGRRIIDILSQEKVKKIKELSLSLSTKNQLRVECQQLAQRINVLI